MTRRDSELLRGSTAMMLLLLGCPLQYRSGYERGSVAVPLREFVAE